MSVADVKKNTDQKMQKSIETLKNDLAKVRTGRAHVGMLDHVQVDYYGTPTHINQVANVTLLDARTIGVQPWEKKMIATVEKAIRESKLGLNPAAADRSIRVPIPELSEERRRDMVKLIKQLAEEAKVRLRSARKAGLDEAKKMKADVILTEDSFKDYEKQVQDLTNKYTKKIDELAVAKEEDLMKI